VQLRQDSLNNILAILRSAFSATQNVCVPPFHVLDVQVLHSHVLHFQAFQVGPSLSGAAISCHAIWSVIFTFQVFRFHSVHFQRRTQDAVTHMKFYNCNNSTFISVKHPHSTRSSPLPAFLDYQHHNKSQIAAFDTSLKPSHSESFYFSLSSPSKQQIIFVCRLTTLTIPHSWLRGPAVERRSLADVLSLSCARPVADG